MMPQVKLLSAAADVMLHRNGPLTVLISCPDGCEVDRFLAARQRGEDFATAASNCCDDSTIIEFRRDDTTKQLLELNVFRGITTSREVYYHVDKSGNLLLADHFRNLLAAIPLQDRHVRVERVIEHLLFAVIPGRHTCLQNVHRLGHGEMLNFTAAARLRITRAERLESQFDGPIPPDAVDAVDAALGDTVRRFAKHDSVVNMLSGGVDSTLTHTYLGTDVPSISGSIESPEFAPEVNYARSASEILGTSHTMVEVPEKNYLETLESCIDAISQPVGHLQTVLFHRVLDSTHERFFCGQGADSIFGLGVLPDLMSAWRRRHLAAIAGVLGLKAFSWSRPVAEMLARTTDDPRGMAAHFAMYTIEDAVRSAYGDEAVDARLAERLDYTSGCVAVSNDKDTGVYEHIHTGQILDCFCDCVVSVWRQLAMSHRKILCTPYTNRRVMQATLRIPAKYRYIQGSRPKYLLKQLLAAKAPGYETDKVKLAGGLPIARFYTSGPLSAVWEKYPVPETIAPVIEAMATRQPYLLNYNMVTFGIWHERVLRNPAVTMVPGTQVTDFELPPAVRLTPAEAQEI